MPAFTWSALTAEAIDPGHSPAGPVMRGEKIAVGLVRYPAGTEARPHARPHEQVVSILGGRASYRVGREERVVGPAEAVLVRPNTDYAFRALEDLEVAVFRDVLPASGARPAEAAGSAFYRWDEMKADFITPKYSSGRGPVITGERIEVAYMFYPAGTEAKPHSHPNEQIQICLAGRIKAVIGGQESIVGPGGGIMMPSNVEHGIQILEDYTTINCKDIVPGFSVYHARWDRPAAPRRP